MSPVIITSLFSTLIVVKRFVSKVKKFSAKWLDESGGFIHDSYYESICFWITNFQPNTL